VSLSLKTTTLDAVTPLDFRSPFDELTELRSVLTTKEIAELTGLRRETISRARPDRRFQQRTEKSLADLYAVVTRMRSVLGGDLGQLAAILRRPQPELGGRSIAELLRGGEVEVVLEHLATPEPGTSPGSAAPPRREDAVEAFLVADPEVAALLPEIEAKLREYFAPVQRIQRGVSVEAGADDELYLWARNDLPYDENSKRFRALLEQERDLLRPVRTRVNVGFM
jgi:hypothetical protein